MEQVKKLYVGFDLCNNVSQISCYSYKLGEPKSICPHPEDEHYMIPTVLYVTKNKEWLYGEAALNEKDNDAGIFVDHILSKIMSGESTVIYDISFDGTTLLERFFRKSLKLVKQYFPGEYISRICITVEKLTKELHDAVVEALGRLGLTKDKIYVISHTKAYLHYALSQPKELWFNDIGLFDFNEDGIAYYQININRRSKPMYAGVVKKDYSEILKYDMLKNQEANIRYIFENIVNEALHKQIISSLYFNGVGFDGKWADEIMVKLCSGRRVFKGQNLYTKGACYAAKEDNQDVKQDIVLFGEEMLTSSILLKAYYDARMQSVFLLKAAIPWYEAKNQIEVIVDQEKGLEFEIQNDILRFTQTVTIALEDLPERPRKMTRLKIKLTPQNTDSVMIEIEDLGFGAFSPATHMKWQRLVEI